MNSSGKMTALKLTYQNSNQYMIGSQAKKIAKAYDAKKARQVTAYININSQKILKARVEP